MLAVALEMMTVGMRIDLDHLAILSQQCLDLMQTEADKVAELGGQRINPNSDTQVRQLVYKDLGFKPITITILWVSHTCAYHYLPISISNTSINPFSFSIGSNTPHTRQVASLSPTL